MSDDQARAIINTAHEAFISMDAGGFIDDWNPQAEVTFGWSREEAVGRVLADLIIPERYRERHWQGLQRFMETGEARWSTAVPRSRRFIERASRFRSS